MAKDEGRRTMGRRPDLVRAVRIAGLGLLLVAPAAWAGPVSGTVETRVRAGVSAAPAVVYAEPLDVAAPKRPGRFTLAQKHRIFHPRVLAVPTGSSVSFPNDDLIFHNVFALSGPQPFNLGLYRSGDTRARTFTQPAAYRVFCNIHSQMSAFLVVVPTPYIAPVDASGRYTLELPPGRYRLTALSERAAPGSVEVTSTVGAVVAGAIALDESTFVTAPRTNKFGQPYPDASYTR